MNDKSGWTLERELQKLTGMHSTSEALLHLGLISEIGQKFSLLPSQEGWSRGGAETYLYRFEVRSVDREIPLLLKACVAFSPTLDLERILGDWIKRRELLSARGIKTPILYCSGFGVILEEDVPYTVEEALRADIGKTDSILLGLAALAGVVESLGFRPVSLFDDLRSHGNDVIVVDFGEDLGPPDLVKYNHGDLFSTLVKQVEKWEVEIRPDLKNKLLSVFEAGLITSAGAASWHN